MPRTKKPAGTVADPRNGRRSVVAASSLAKFALPAAHKPPYLPETRKAWLALWSDPVARALTPVDRPVLERWADHLDRAQRHYALGDEDPVVPGHAGQPVESPHYAIADRAMRVVEKCEAQLGVGALNRARLGIAIVAERASLDEMNARLRRGDDAPRRPDPRVVPGSVVAG